MNTGPRTIDGILDIADDTAFAMALADRVARRPVRFEDLSPGEQVVACVDELEREVNNGGFEQFFLNSGGNYAAETLQALKAIGAQHTAALLERAMAVFPNPPSSDRNVRQQQVGSLGAGERELLDGLDQNFYQYRDKLASLLRKYALQHRSDFQ